MRVEYHPAVEFELLEIRNYYEARSPGLGMQFIDEFESQILAIVAAPEKWLVVAGDIRRCLMRRFPYVIYFRLADQQCLRVTVVKHQRRHPNLGRERQ